jgi:hydroxyacylglutathione hydrolase
VINVSTIVSGKWRENCYILSAGTDAVVIDPGEDADAILSHLDASGLVVKAILCTHAHYDHIGSVSDLKSRYAAPFYLHAADNKLLRQANLYRKLFGGERMIAIPTVDVDLATSSALQFPGIDIDVMHTPGHTPGGVALFTREAVFVGDTIFRNRAGRTDLPGGDKAAIEASLRKLLSSSPELLVYPGHGEPVRLAKVIANNGDLADAS